MNSLSTLKLSGKIWFIIAAIGQWFFGIYITLFYGGSTLLGNFENWNKVLPHGYVEGEFWGNLLVGIHVMFAMIMVIGGPLQFIPQIRNRFRTFHRLLGKTYVFMSIIMAIDGFTMIWTRGSVGGTFQHINISIQAIYIILFAFLTIKFARNREFAKHQNWAWRLFMVSNGVWFFRVGLMAWLIIHQAPVGFDKETFDGPFLWVLSTLAYSIPLSLIVFEMYLHAEKSQNKTFQLTTASVIFILTLIMTIGIIGATIGMWLPRIH
jgi:uncharacterized membrane protein